jgi:hypothetical protein
MVGQEATQQAIAMAQALDKNIQQHLLGYECVSKPEQ